jgi:hypothetical protein
MKKKKESTLDSYFERRDFSTGCGRATCREKTAAACAADELRAYKEGGALLARMKGAGWRLSVWENLGWHYAVYSGAITVHPSRHGGRTTYSALMSSELPLEGSHPGGGSMLWHDSEHRRFAEPNAAVRFQLKLAQAVLAGLVKTVTVTAATLPGGARGRA